mmetsp:Transcript_20598/g.53551  ORF Transcript_20598/g.53551 Transcript_20598/m.53551 type:complete len:234 (+) Transcript_20598:404-1105(+)
MCDSGILLSTWTSRIISIRSVCEAPSLSFFVTSAVSCSLTPAVCCVTNHFATISSPSTPLKYPITSSNPRLLGGKNRCNLSWSPPLIKDAPACWIVRTLSHDWNRAVMNVSTVPLSTSLCSSVRFPRGLLEIIFVASMYAVDCASLPMCSSVNPDRYLRILSYDSSSDTARYLYLRTITRTTSAAFFWAPSSPSTSRAANGFFEPSSAGVMTPPGANVPPQIRMSKRGSAYVL